MDDSQTDKQGVMTGMDFEFKRALVFNTIQMLLTADIDTVVEFQIDYVDVYAPEALIHEDIGKVVIKKDYEDGMVLGARGIAFVMPYKEGFTRIDIPVGAIRAIYMADTEDGIKLPAIYPEVGILIDDEEDEDDWYPEEVTNKEE